MCIPRWEGRVVTTLGDPPNQNLSDQNQTLDHCFQDAHRRVSPSLARMPDLRKTFEAGEGTIVGPLAVAVRLVLAATQHFQLGAGVRINFR